MVSKAERDARPGTSLAAVHFFPAVGTSAKTRHIFEIDREGSGAVDGDQTDDDAVAERTGPVWVDLSIHRTAGSGRLEGRCCFAELILIDY